jgi:glycosyltransferase involved in cell wall biosynthesis
MVMQKKILVIHNKYRNIGGEDISVENEIKTLKKKYKVEELYFYNYDFNIITQIFYFIMNKNYTSMKLLKNKINVFKPDLVYVHNTWFRASPGVFQILENYSVPIVVKVHNFRYNCTKSFFSNKHLKNETFCKACYFTKPKLSFFNKYFPESYLKSFLVVRYGRKYFDILKHGNLKILVLTEHHKSFLKELGFSMDKVKIARNYIEVNNQNSIINIEDYIVYAGRISEEKGVSNLINNFLACNFSNLKLKIIGDGPILNQLKKKFQSPQLEFLGLKNHDEVLHLISNSQAVITATKLYEGQPTLLCEASLLKIPSIFPSAGGISEFFPKEYPLMYNSSDNRNMINKLKMLENKSLLKQIGNENYEFLSQLIDEDSYFLQIENLLTIQSK